MITWTRSLSGRKNNIGIVVDVMNEPYYAKVNYTITDHDSSDKTDYDYKILIVTELCHFGGVRYWFICPLSKNGVPCGRRVGMLFLSTDNKYSGCRHCYDLSYESQNECRLGRFGSWGYVLKAERQIRELEEKVKRRTWRGRPTRKVRRINVFLER